MKSHLHKKKHCNFLSGKMKNNMFNLKLQAPDGWFIRMTVEDLHLPANFFNRCNSWLEIQYNLPGQTGIM